MRRPRTVHDYRLSPPCESRHDAPPDIKVLSSCFRVSLLPTISCNEFDVKCYTDEAEGFVMVMGALYESTLRAIENF